MSQTIALQSQQSLVLPAELLKEYRTNQFIVTSLNGALLVEPANQHDDAPLALNQTEEQKLEQALQEPSLPLSQLSR